MAKLECFAVAGIETWFFSNDHLPPHFHAKRKGQWEIRLHFLESSTSEIFHVVWRKGKEIPRTDTKLLEERWRRTALRFSKNGSAKYNRNEDRIQNRQGDSLRSTSLPYASLHAH
jgi:hypothetical protein